jgi:ribose transport system substrate-binding protein
MSASRFAAGWLVLCGILPAVVLAQSAAPRTVGFAQDTLANDWRRAQVEELRRAFAAGAPPVDLIVTDANADVARQVRDVEDLIHRKVDVLITSPRDGRVMAPVIGSAYHAGTPVILLTRSIPNQDYSTLVGADDRAIARKAARFMADRLKGRGNILMLQGVPTASTAIDRTAGFLEELRQHPGLKVSAIKVGNYLRPDAIRAVEEALQEQIPFEAIYAQSDSMAAGARLALRKAGRDPARLLIVGIDYIAEAREAIRKGEQAASFTYPTGAQEAAGAARALLRGETVPKRIVVESVMVTRDNVEQIRPIF